MEATYDLTDIGNEKIINLSRLSDRFIRKLNSTLTNEKAFYAIECALMTKEGSLSISSDDETVCIRNVEQLLELQNYCKSHLRNSQIDKIIAKPKLSFMKKISNFFMK